MQTPVPDHLTLESAQVLLRRFLCTDPATDGEMGDRSLVQQAVLLVTHHSDYQIFGICADTATQATTALKAYLHALGYDPAPDVPSTEGPVYLKFNPKQGKLHLEPYTGRHRGVLVSCQSAYDGDVNETFGHLPVDLFDSPV